MTRSERDKAYREAHKDKLRAYLKNYRETNREQLRAKAKARYRRDAEKKSAESRLYRRVNQAAISARRKARWAREKENINAKRRAKKALPTERAKASQRRRVKLYGLTPATFQDIIDAQGDGCAICTKSTRVERMVVDHCHKTGLVRGILCPRCNSALGLLDDAPRKLRWAAEYLENFETDLRDNGCSGAISTLSSEPSSAA